jgi:hypothetical protein
MEEDWVRFVNEAEEAISREHTQRIAYRTSSRASTTASKTKPTG